MLDIKILNYGTFRKESIKQEKEFNYQLEETERISLYKDYLKDIKKHISKELKMLGENK